MNKKRIVFILNPISGTISKAGIPDLIEERLNKSEFDYNILETQYAGHATELAKQAVKDGINIVVAIGGDGTVNEIGKSLINTSTAMAILPCGSGNGLARHLLIPMKIKGAIQVLNDCEITDLDYGIINEHPFFCTCGVGFDAFISEKFAEAGKRGPITYLENILKEGLKYKPETYEIEAENGTIKKKAFLISCANASQYGNNAYIAPQASMSDGMIDVIIMEPFDALEASQISIEMFNKTLDKNNKIKTFRSKEIKIYRKAPGVIHYDGDPVETGKEIVVTLKEKGIKILTNPKADRSLRQPNQIQNAAAELFSELTQIREDVTKQTRNIKAIGKKIQRKLNI